MRRVILFIFSERAVWGVGGGGYAARLFILFSFPCSADHERDWPPCKVVFRVGNQYAECEKQQQQQQQLLGFQFSLTAQSTSLRESFGWSNQRGSKTSQACYSHPRCNLNLVRLFRFSLLLPLIGRIFFFPRPHGHKPTTPSYYMPVCY